MGTFINMILNIFSIDFDNLQESLLNKCISLLDSLPIKYIPEFKKSLSRGSIEEIATNAMTDLSPLMSVLIQYYGKYQDLYTRFEKGENIIAEVYSLLYLIFYDETKVFNLK